MRAYTLRPSLLLLLLAVVAAPALGQPLTQTVPFGWDSGAGGGGSAYPFNATGSHIWQWHYDSVQFQATGPITIVEVYVRTLSSTTAAAFNFPSVELVMASSPTNYTVAATATQPGHNPVFALNLNSDATIVRPAAPWTSAAPVPPGWMPMGMTTPFTYDPTQGNDFVLQIRKCGTIVTWGQSIFGTVCCNLGQGGNRYGDTASCTATSQTFSNNEYVPIIKIDYLPASSAPEYQVNQNGAALTLNGIIGGPFAPAQVTLGVNQPGVLTFGGYNVTQLWELGLGSAPLKSRSGGALMTSDGQILNLDVADPSFVFLWNFFQSPPFFPFSTTVTIPAPMTLSAQMAVIDPGQFSGLSLSQPIRVTIQ